MLYLSQQVSKYTAAIHIKWMRSEVLAAHRVYFGKANQLEILKPPLIGNFKNTFASIISCCLKTSFSLCQGRNAAIVLRQLPAWLWLFKRSRRLSVTPFRPGLNLNLNFLFKVQWTMCGYSWTASAWYRIGEKKKMQSYLHTSFVL
jgi:hypothetical protein